MKSCGRIKLAADAPRKMMRPSLFETAAERSAETRIKKVLSATRPTSTRPLRTGPSRVIGSKVGVVTQAT